MKRVLGAVLAFSGLALAGCAGSVGNAFLVSVAIQGAFKSANVGGSPLPVTATLNNDVATSGGVSWSLTVGGKSCSPACGTIAPGAFPALSATYTPPDSDPAVTDLNPTITATSVSSPTQNASFSFQLLTKTVFSYVVALRGFDDFGSPLAIVGNIVIDDVGNVRGGELDVNEGHQVTLVAGPLTGSYNIQSASGAVTRGTIDIPNVALSGSIKNLSFKFVVSLDRSHGTIIELDNTNYLNAGTIQLQDPTAVNGSIPSGAFAFGLDSEDPLGSRVVEAGQITLQGFGFGIADQSQANAAAPIYSAAGVTVSAGSPDSSGRGTLQLNVNGGSSQYAYYIADANTLYLIEIGSGSSTVQSGTAHLQSSMTSSSVNMTSVIQLTGINPVSGMNTFAPDALIGAATVTGNTSLNLIFDSNNVGTIVTQANAVGSVVSFDPTTGRGILSLPTGFSGGALNSAVFYLYDSGDGYIIDTDSTSPGGTTNYGLSGTLIARTSSLALSNGAILGLGGFPTRHVPNVTAAIDFTGAAFSGTGTLTSFFKADGPYIDSSFINATYQVTDTANGYGTAVVPASLFGNFTPKTNASASFYLIDTNRAVMLGTQSGDYSGVLFYAPF